MASAIESMRTIRTLSARNMPPSIPADDQLLVLLGHIRSSIPFIERTCNVKGSRYHTARV